MSPSTSAGRGSPSRACKGCSSRLHTVTRLPQLDVFDGGGSSATRRRGAERRQFGPASRAPATPLVSISFVVTAWSEEGARGCAAKGTRVSFRSLAAVPTWWCRRCHREEVAVDAEARHEGGEELWRRWSFVFLGLTRFGLEGCWWTWVGLGLGFIKVADGLGELGLDEDGAY